jgi:hypothetical protein
MKKVYIFIMSLICILILACQNRSKYVEVRNNEIIITIPSPTAGLIRVGQVHYEVSPSTIDEEVYRIFHNSDYNGTFLVRLHVKNQNKYGENTIEDAGIIGNVKAEEIKRYTDVNYFQLISPMINDYFFPKREEYIHNDLHDNRNSSTEASRPTFSKYNIFAPEDQKDYSPQFGIENTQ